MSTRCQVQVVQVGSGAVDGGDKITLYHHCDGYPEHMLPTMAAAFQGKERDWRAGRAGKVAAILCAHEDGFEPEDGHALHGDIEWYYRLWVKFDADAGASWEVEVFRPHHPSDYNQPSTEGRRVLLRREITEAAKNWE